MYCLEINLLIGIPSPRNIPEVTCHWLDIPHDKLIVKYYKEWSAYQVIRNYFLDHEEYTHLGLAPDDMVLKPIDIKILLDNLQEHDYQVFSGTAGINEDRPDLITCTPYESAPTIENRTGIKWMERKDVRGIIEVGHSGFPFQIIRRDVVEMFDFDSQSKIEGRDPNDVGNLDMVFCTRMRENKIKIYANTNVFMYHMRTAKGIQIVGVKRPRVEFISKEESKR